MEAAVKLGPAPRDRRPGRGCSQAEAYIESAARLVPFDAPVFARSGSMHSSPSFFTLLVGALTCLFTKA